MSTFRHHLLKPLGLIAGAAVMAAVMSRTEETGRPLFRSAFPLDALRSVDPADAKVSAEILIRRIVEQQGYDYTTAIPENHTEFLTGLLQNQYDFFLIFASEYLRQRSHYPMEPRLAGVRDGDLPMERLILVTSADSKIEDLEGGTLLMEGWSGGLATIWLEEELAMRGVANPAGFFEEVRTTRSAGETVVPVFFGKADACIVTEEALGIMAELNPQIEVRLTRQITSDPLLITLLCVRPGYKERKPGMIDDVSTRLHETPDGGQILTLMRVKKLVPFRDEFLEGTEKLLHRRAVRLGSKKPKEEAENPVTRKGTDDGAP